MSVAITDQTSYVQFVLDEETYKIQKGSLIAIPLDGDGDGVIITAFGVKQFTFTNVETFVTEPANSGQEDLIGKLNFIFSSGGGGGGGGGAVTIANGADSATGNTSDSAYVSGSGTVISILKGIFGRLLFSKNKGDVDSNTIRVYSAGNMPYGADYLVQSNADVNGNYQTITYKSGGSGGTTVKTVNLTFDANGGVLTLTES